MLKAMNPRIQGSLDIFQLKNQTKFRSRTTKNKAQAHNSSVNFMHVAAHIIFCVYCSKQWANGRLGISNIHILLHKTVNQLPRRYPTNQPIPDFKMLAIRSIGIRSTARVVPRLLVARPFTTVKSDATENAEDAILKAQRLNRPTSPHLEIYKFELPMIMSSFHRITGVVLAGTFYGITCTYALSSLLGVADYSAALASTFAALPFVAKLAAKGILAFPFAFHAFNGIRHLIWDAGKELTIKGVYRTGYVVTGLSLVVGAYLTFI